MECSDIIVVCVIVSREVFKRVSLVPKENAESYDNSRAKNVCYL